MLRVGEIFLLAVSFFGITLLIGVAESQALTERIYNGVLVRFVATEKGRNDILRQA